jgi:effector-binding domain-containing protein
MRYSLPICTFFLFLLSACNSNSEKKAVPAKNDTLVVKKENLQKKEGKDDTKKPPILNIVDTVSVKMIVVCMKDSAANYNRIALKLSQIYGAKLAEVFKKNKIRQAGAPMAWYKSYKAPYFFEAGIPVDKRPTKLPRGVFVKETKADSVVLAHFFGPYDLIPKGYDAIKEWIKDNNKPALGFPYEVYVSDPIDKKGKPVDPYKVQTDIVFPRK